MLFPAGVAIDASGTVWVANNTNFSVTRLTHSGSLISGPNGYLGGGLCSPYGIATDVIGNAWITSQNPFLLTKLSTNNAAISGSGGYTASGLNFPTSIAIDGSGDTWVANNGANTVSEFIGVATPVVTPIVAGLPATPTAIGTSKLGTQP